MKYFIVAAAVIGLAAFASPVQAGPPAGNLYLAGHHHHHHNHQAYYYRPPVVRYYPPQVRYYTPPPVCAEPVYTPPAVYGSYYRPWNSVSVGGPNFGVQFGW